MIFTIFVPSSGLQDFLSYSDEGDDDDNDNDDDDDENNNSSKDNHDADDHGIKRQPKQQDNKKDQHK